MSIIAGIDPDSKAHGVAIYVNGKLTELHCWTLMEIHGWLSLHVDDEIIFHVENVKASNKAYAKRGAGSAGAIQNVARSVGMVQQSQTELERVIAHFGRTIVHHKPSSAWKKASAVPTFKAATGWTGQSNPDKRSASYFGWLGSRLKTERSHRQPSR